MASMHKVEFQTFDGTTLQGNLFLPERKNAPIIVMSVGLTFLKEHFGDIPDRLRDSGFAVLAFDPRNWGSSDGTPRQHINLYEQSDDVSDAITFACTQTPAVDPERVCVWGAGHGGGVMMPVAAIDPRVKVIVVAMPFISGLHDSESFPAGFTDLIWKERIDHAMNPKSTKEPAYVPIFPESLEVAKKNPYSTIIGLPQIVGFHEGAKALAEAAGVPWENKVTLQSLFHQRRWEPSAYLPQITIPFLYITARKDEFTPHQKHMEVYRKLKGPKHLLVLDSENLEAFMSEQLRKKFLDEQLRFLNDHL